MSKYLDSNGLLYFWQQLKTKFQPQEAGKGLSTNDYTTEDKTKLSGIQAGAEVNVNADWNAASGDAQILNKPTIPDKTSQLTNDSGFITSSDIPEGAAASTTVPKMDSVAAVGTEMAFARGDHVHPSDTSKVDKVDGKALSTNDLTNELKSQYDAAYSYSQEEHAPVNAQENVIEAISVNGAPQSISGKSVNLTVPTTVAQLTDSGNYALKSEITNVYKYKGSVANFEALPTESNTIGDVYDVQDTGMNYAWNGTAWDALGEKFKIDSIQNGEIDTILQQ